MPYVEPKIDIRMLWEPGGNLGAEYNRCFKESPHDWLLFVDPDVLLLNPVYYLVMQEVIRRNPDTGVFTCFANSIGGRWQKTPGKPAIEAPLMRHDGSKRDDSHLGFAQRWWDKFQYQCTELKPESYEDCPGGFLMLISRKTWDTVGGFTNGMHVDRRFYWNCVVNKIPIMRIDGLYCYHARDRRAKKTRWMEDVPLSTEIR